MRQNQQNTDETKRISAEFNDLLEISLSKLSYDNLADILGVSTNKKTRLLNDPKSCPAKLIPTFSRLIGLHSFLLVRDYKLGFDIIPMSAYNNYFKDYEKRKEQKQTSILEENKAA